MRLLIAALLATVAGLLFTTRDIQPAPLRPVVTKGDPCGPQPPEAVATATGGVLVYGDSIAVGGWPKALGWQADARGCRSLFGDRNAAPRLLAKAPEAVWIAIGTNDYDLSAWTPAEFGAAYGRLLDDLRSVKVYAQTPILRYHERRNRKGATLDDYRAAIMVECRQRAWVTCVDGTALVPVELLPDGVHPEAEGQRVYAARVRTSLSRPPSSPSRW